MQAVWLIEMIEPEKNKPPVPRWWHPECGWMWDANKALRFAREIDARDYVRHTKFLQGKPTEHVFIGETEITEEWLAEVLNDSIDMDWTGAVGARAIMRALQGKADA